MERINDTGSAPPERDEILEDLDALAPATVPVRIRGTVHQVIKFLDLPYRQAVELLRIEEQLRETKEYKDWLDLLRVQTRILCPGLTEGDLNELSRAQMMRIGQKSMELPARPQLGSGDASGADSSPI